MEFIWSEPKSKLQVATDKKGSLTVGPNQTRNGPHLPAGSQSQVRLLGNLVVHLA